MQAAACGGEQQTWDTRGALSLATRPLYSIERKLLAVWYVALLSGGYVVQGYVSRRRRRLNPNLKVRARLAETVPSPFAGAKCVQKVQQR